ncbi:MAG TPA: hypothetical protein P5230_03095 [Candidatus Magasanikbacteria bacterium]|nr:hypothetical protein [Candidatus Magasanikbacteria bacterium]
MEKTMLRFFEEMVIFLKALGHRNSRALFDPKNRKKVIDFCEDKLISAKKYPISIDYDEEKNEEVVFDVVHKECNFPAVIEHGVFNLDLELFNPFEGRPTTEDVLSHMEENRLRPATFHEFKVFIRTYPEIKKKGVYGSCSWVRY